MSLMKWFSSVESNRIDREIEDSVEPIPYSFCSSFSVPRIYVYGTEKDVIVKAEIPGNKKENIDLFIEDNIIRLSGKCLIKKTDINKNLCEGEKSWEQFSKTIPLPYAVKGEHATVEYRDGILSIVVPKSNKKHNTIGN